MKREPGRRRPTYVLLAAGAIASACASPACLSGPTVTADNPDATTGARTPGGPSPGDGGAGAPDVVPYDPDAAAPAGAYCSLPGSVLSTTEGIMVVPGADAGAPDITWLHVPVGFCTHYFATVNTARQLKFAPGGDLFVASPTTATTGGAGNGVAGVVVLPDDDHDGVADSNITFLSNLPSVQGLLFAGGYFYYQDDETVQRIPFQPGDRQPSAAGTLVTDMSDWPQAREHWPRVFDVAEDGTMYVTNGGSQSDQCTSAWPVRGAVFRVEADGTTTEVAMGFRNPIALRCEASHDVCLAVELALDYSGAAGGREKLVPVRQGDNWGYPCCATRGLPYSGVTYADIGGTPDCSGVAQEDDSFIIGHTPFGLDFETGAWPAPWTGRVFVTLHGDFQSWDGARVVAIALDPTTGLPLPATELDGGAGDADDMLGFATGWDDGQQDHGRPAPVAFAPDGRMFLGDDQKGAVVWIAPMGLMPTE